MLALPHPSRMMRVILTLLFLSLIAHAAAESTHLTPRDAYTSYTGDHTKEGEAHGAIVAPKGSKFTSIKVGSGGEQIAAYWTSTPNNAKAKQAFIMIHGKERDGDVYWTTMNTILTLALKNKTLNADSNSIVVAPEFFSTKYNSGQYSSHELAWGDTNAWQSGDVATHPKGTKLTSFDALDALVAEFSNASKYPSMKNITVVGHGGGGQLNQRYAMVAKNSPPGIHIRYIHGDPSSTAYFTANRPIKMSSGYKLPSRDSCSLFNTWRYGFDGFKGTSAGLLSPQQYFQQYITRDVISIVGLQDTAAAGDTTCMANKMGGSIRRDRNLAWWQYINTLARTKENLYGFPATYGTLPDWSSISHNAISLQLVVVQNADHDAGEVFGSSEGLATLFLKGKMPTGWRPNGWAAAGRKASSTSQTTTKSARSYNGEGDSNIPAGKEPSVHHERYPRRAFRKHGWTNKTI